MRLRVGMKVAIPKDLKKLSIWDISPFPKYLEQFKGQTSIIVDQKKLAWGAYNTDGELQWWGPISSGKNYCPDVKRNCYTVTGEFYVFNKDGPACVSSKFPVGRGGAKMPYCMFFYRGFAVHGSNEVPGYRESHGCIRIFKEDAKWLNHTFITLPSKEDNNKGTLIVVQDVK